MERGKKRPTVRACVRPIFNSIMQTREAATAELDQREATNGRTDAFSPGELRH